MKLSSALLSLSLLAGVLSSSAKAQQITVVLSTNWALNSGNTIAPCSLTDVQVNGSSSTVCAVSTNPTTAEASARGAALAPNSVTANPLLCIGGRTATYISNKGGCADVQASASAQAARLAVQPGQGFARARASFTSTVPGTNVFASGRAKMALPALISVPVTVHKSACGLQSFQYTTSTKARTKLILPVGGSARLWAFAQVAASILLS